MALKTSFPAPTGKAISSPDSRSALAGLVQRSPAGVPRAGILPRTTTDLVTSRASMGVDVAAFEAVVVRNSLPSFLPNDGTTVVSGFAAPGANSIYHVIYVKQNEASAPFSDGNDNAGFDFVSSTAAPSPSLAAAIAAVPAGGLPLAAILMPSTATTTQSAGVVITQLYAYTCPTGGVLWFRNTTERDAAAIAEGQLGWLIDTDKLQLYSTGWADLSQDTTAWAALPMSSSWLDFNAAGGTYQILQYRRHNGIVQVRGLIKNGTIAGGTVIATLPVGFRPLKQRVMSAIANFVSGSVEVKANGEIIAGTVSSNASLSLEFSFAAEQ